MPPKKRPASDSAADLRPRKVNRVTLRRWELLDEIFLRGVEMIPCANCLLHESECVALQENPSICAACLGARRTGCDVAARGVSRREYPFRSSCVANWL